MALFGGKTPAQLTLTDAIMTGFRMVTQVNFVIPILVIGVIVNAIVIAAILPIVIGVILPNSATDSTVLGGAIIAGIIGGVIGGIIGGLLLNLYGQVWATMASVGDGPTIQAAFARVGLRWMSILGAGLIVGFVLVGIIIVGGILAALLGPLGIVVLIVAAIAAIYLGARLSIAGWLAADGAAAMEAVQTSWTMTEGKLLLIIGWGLAFGIVFGIVGGIVGAILGIIPLVGPALAQTVSVAFGFGGGVTLYRKVKGS
ncbi:MAG: hypothetical protein HY264_03505 [Chloroflexi bacterium]|nr:hypothetical protein [Chloroflexota bacterium]